MADASYVRRFSRTERAVHWIHAPAFFLLLATGLVLYVPALSDAVGRRETIKTIHVYLAIGWVAALLVTYIAGDRAGLRDTRRELERLDLDDVRWLAGWPTPQGRFNAGQKVHAIVQAAIAILFAGSGTLLWLGERDTTLRLSGTIVLHDWLTYAATILVLGHLYLALIAPSTRPSLRGIVHGTVRETWAQGHHPKWAGGIATLHPGARWPRPGVRKFLVSVAVLILAVGTYAAVRPHSAARATARTGTFSPAPVPPAIAHGDALAQQALALDQGGNAAGALPLYAEAVRILPGVAEIRAFYGWALARTGHAAQGSAQLREAVRLNPSLPVARLYLGAALERAGRRAQARVQLRRAIALDPGGATGTAAQRLLTRG